MEPGQRGRAEPGRRWGRGGVGRSRGGGGGWAEPGRRGAGGAGAGAELAPGSAQSS